MTRRFGLCLKKWFDPEKIIHRLRKAEVRSSQGGEISPHSGITKQTYFRWRKEYGGLKIDLAKRLKDLEQKNA
jgi:putative transposase